MFNRLKPDQSMLAPSKPEPPPPPLTGRQELEKFQTYVTSGAHVFVVFASEAIVLNPAIGTYTVPMNPRMGEFIVQDTTAEDLEMGLLALIAVRSEVGIPSRTMYPIQSVGHDPASAWALFLTRQLRVARDLNPDLVQARVEILRGFLKPLSSRERLQITRYVDPDEKALLGNAMR